MDAEAEDFGMQESDSLSPLYPAPPLPTSGSRRLMPAARTIHSFTPPPSVSLLNTSDVPLGQTGGFPYSLCRPQRNAMWSLYLGSDHCSKTPGFPSTAKLLLSRLSFPRSRCLCARSDRLHPRQVVKSSLRYPLPVNTLVPPAAPSSLLQAQQLGSAPGTAAALAGRHTSSTRYRQGIHPSVARPRGPDGTLASRLRVSGAASSSAAGRYLLGDPSDASVERQLIH